MQSGGSQVQSMQLLLKEARQHAAELQTDKHQLEHSQQNLQHALAQVSHVLPCSRTTLCGDLGGALSQMSLGVFHNRSL